LHCHRHIGPHETHTEEGSDLDHAKEQQKQCLSQNAPTPYGAKILAETIEQGISPHRQLS
jgi:hypothetical protein